MDRFDALENVQKRTTKLIHGVLNWNRYKESMIMIRLKLPTLLFHRYSGDIIETACSRLDIRKHSFPMRVFDKWNHLPEYVIHYKCRNN